MRRLLVLMFTFALFSGCGQSSHESNPVKSQHEGMMDTASLRGLKFIGVWGENEVIILLSFDPDKDLAYGKIGNNYSAPYEISGNHIKFGTIATTMMMPLPHIFEAEQAYLAFLAEVNKYYYNKDENELTLYDKNGEEFKFAKVNK